MEGSFIWLPTAVRMTKALTANIATLAAISSTPVVVFKSSVYLDRLCLLLFAVLWDTAKWTLHL